MEIPRSVNAGSSPLARGLRRVVPVERFDPGIIPARAGFTRLGRLRIDGPRDHPRSRGVYRRVDGRQAAGGGSSPLARGLRLQLRQLDGRPGIIPARAGFTVPSVSSQQHRGDHPRSRGVYPRDAAPPWSSSGSSPLARGLPVPGALPGVEAGIIPARAGFTSTCEPGLPRARDHPRSRGVYPAGATAAAVVRGSSPLARGLHEAPGLQPAAEGIIPARAGFTLADPWNPNEPVLYQTPVAFTADLGSAPPSCGSAAVVLRWTTTPSGA